MTECDWLNPEYLRNGNSRQKRVFQILTKIQILEILKKFDPIVVGTIPIGIDIPNSDIDIVCNVTDLETFQTIIQNNFSTYTLFSERIRQEEKVYIANFYCDTIEIEIYATNKPSILQNGFKHMVIEDRILKLAGDQFRDEIIKLKTEGYKTEPAFGKLLELDNPYTDLLNLGELSDKDLTSFISERIK